MTKIFIISLPRTATTSVCIFLLEQGFKVAHTAYSDSTFEQADVIADTPVFADYSQLDKRYPHSKFIVLKRPLVQWVPSIRRLLTSMRKQWVRNPNVLEEDIWRCFKWAFPEFEQKTTFDDAYLESCYRQHQAAIHKHFCHRQDCLLSVDITDVDAGERIYTFCSGRVDISLEKTLPHVNRGRRITYWNDVSHENKIDSKL